MKAIGKNILIKFDQPAEEKTESGLFVPRGAHQTLRAVHRGQVFSIGCDVPDKIAKDVAGKFVLYDPTRQFDFADKVISIQFDAIIYAEE